MRLILCAPDPPGKTHGATATGRKQHRVDRREHGICATLALCGAILDRRSATWMPACGTCERIWTEKGDEIRAQIRAESVRRRQLSALFRDA